MAKKPAAPDPDKLQRQQAGTYRTADERFDVRQADQGWFLVDAQQTDGFGQPLVRGPFTTLQAVRDAIPEARSAKVVSLARRSAATRPAGTGKAPTPPKATPKPTWLDQLPSDERASARRLIGALESQGVKDAEQLVRRDRDGLLPAIAATLLQRRLDALLADANDEERKLVATVVKLLTSDGRSLRDPLPGWSLVELGPEPEPPNRRITLDSRASGPGHG